MTIPFLREIEIGESDMATPLNTWGPSCWHFLHCVGFTYEERATSSDRVAMYAFLRSVGDVLPCKRCRAHYKEHIATHVRGAHAPVLAGREALSAYLVAMHNDVNVRLGKPTVPYAAVRARYMESAHDSEWAVPCVAIVVALLVCVLWWRNGGSDALYASRRW